MSTPQYKFNARHLWVYGPDGGVSTIGLTDFVTAHYHEVDRINFFIEVGEQVKVEMPCAVLIVDEISIDVFSPISGKVVEVNTSLEDSIEDLNSGTLRERWLFKMQTDDSGVGLMTADDYAAKRETYSLINILTSD